MYNANLYHDNNNMQKKTATDCIENYARKIIWKSDNRIIDMGCGDGAVTFMLKKYLPKNVIVIGCDINDGMVRLANKYHGDEHTSFKVLDMTGDIPEDMKDYFSHVFSFFAINWVMDQVTTFKNIYNLLEPGGECFLCIVSFNPIFDVYRKLARSNRWKSRVYDVERYISPYHDSQDPEKEIKALMETIGFHNTFTVNDQMIYTYRDMETMRGSLIAICPFTIPDELMNDFWEDYLQELKLLKGCDNAFEDIKFNYKIITVHGRKPRGP